MEKDKKLEDKLITINNQPVLLDKDVTESYGVKPQRLRLSSIQMKL